MKHSNTNYWLLLLVGASVLGKALHMMLSPEYWTAHPWSFRISSLASIIIGVSLIMFARRYRPEKASGSNPPQE